MSKLGCSTRLMVVLGIIVLSLLITGFAIGPIGSKLLGLHLPPQVEMHKPHIQLPSEAIFHVGWFTVTNTLLASWVTILVLFLLFFFATRKARIIPGRLQGLAEIIVEGMSNFIEGVAGSKNARIFLPVVGTIFLYVITNAWLALVPLWGTVGFWEEITSHGEHTRVFVPLLRAANTDVNLTLSIALCSFLFIEYLGFSKIGPLKYVDSFFQFSTTKKDFFDNLVKGKMGPALSGFLFGLINIYVGLLEVLSHFIRIVSFTFRLFGNMTAGEILLTVMTFLIPFIAAVPFYGLETLVGILQAMIFGGLTLVFGVMAISSHHEESAEQH